MPSKKRELAGGLTDGFPEGQMGPTASAGSTARADGGAEISALKLDGAVLLGHADLAVSSSPKVSHNDPSRSLIL